MTETTKDLMMNRPRRFSGLMFTMLIGLVAFAIAPRSFASGSFASVIAFDTATDSLRDASRLHLGTGIARNGDLSTPLGESRDSDLARSAEAAWKAGDWGQAIRLYQRIAEQGSRDEVDQARLQLAVYAGFVEGPSKAIEALDEVIRRASKKRVVQRAMIEKASLLEIRGEDAEARRLLVAVASEAGSWNLVKKATARLKNLDREHNTAHRESERLAQCGIQSLEKALTVGGFEIAPGELVSRLPDRGNVTSLAELADAAAELGAQPFGVRLASREASLLNTPFIAHLRSDHFVTVLAAVVDEVEIFDPGRGTFVWTAAQFSRDWSGRALLLSPSESLAHRAPLTAESRVEGYQTLTPLELRETRGGHHVHGNNLGGSAENGATPFDRGPSPPSPCDSVGLPSLSVNLATFNLVVEDTEFRYGGLGPDIFVRRTYNADDPKVGAFGRSWRFNYELGLEEQPNGGVNLKRGSGREDYFAPLGCTDGVCTYEPPLWSRDELIGNPDGTWDLYLRRSRRTQRFDTSGRLVSITDRNGNSVTLDYDAGGRLTSVTDAAGRVTTFAYGPDGYVSTVVDPAGREASYGYDAEGRLVDHVDMADNVITYTYDEQSYMTSLSTPTGTWSIENVPYADVEFGQVVRSITDPLGHSTTYTTPGFTVVEVEDANGKVWSYFPTGDGEVPLMIDPLGNRTEVTFNEFGEATSVADATGVTLSLNYDSAGNVSSIVDPLGQATEFSYDADGNLSISEEPRGRRYEYEYDEDGNLTGMTDPVGNLTAFDYDPRGLLSSLTDPMGSTWHFVHDSRGNMTAIETPLGFTTHLGYDMVGRTVEISRPDGEILTFSYDGMDRVTQVEYDDSSIVEYIYDCCHLTRVSGDRGTMEFAYDGAGRLIKSTDVHGRSLGYQYDALGNVTALTYPDDRAVVYGYDAASRLKAVTDWSGFEIAYTRDPAGRLMSWRTSNGLATVLSYDEAGRLHRLANFLKDGTTSSFFEFELSPEGRQLARTTQQNPPELVSRSISYSYDADHRILTAGSSQFVHDAVGRMVARSGPDGTTTYSYDVTGQLSSIVADGTTVRQMSFDPLGYPAKIVIGSRESELVVDTQSSLYRLLAMRDPNSPIQDQFVYGLGLVRHEDNSGGLTTYQFDEHGNTVSTLSTAGEVAERFQYTPFGESVASPMMVHEHFGFLGAFASFSPDAGPLLLHARSYDPDLGRFLTPDPAGLAGGLNPYAYALNDPINLADPSGEVVPLFVASIGVVVARVAVATAIRAAAVAARASLLGGRAAATANIRVGLCAANPICADFAQGAAVGLIEELLGHQVPSITQTPQEFVGSVFGSAFGKLINGFGDLWPDGRGGGSASGDPCPQQPDVPTP